MNSNGMRPNVKVPDCEKPIIPYTYHTFIDAHVRGAKVVFVDTKHVMLIGKDSP